MKYIRIMVISVFLISLISVGNVAAEDFQDRPDTEIFGEENWYYDGINDSIVNNGSEALAKNFFVINDKKAKGELDLWVRTVPKENITLDDGFSTTDKLESSVVLYNEPSGNRIVYDLLIHSDKTKIIYKTSSGFSEVSNSTGSFSAGTPYWIHAYDNPNGNATLDVHSDSNGLPDALLNSLNTSTGLGGEKMMLGLSGVGKRVVYDEYWRDNIAPRIESFDYPQNVGTGTNFTVSSLATDYEGDSLSYSVEIGSNKYSGNETTTSISEQGAYPVQVQVQDGSSTRISDTGYISVLSNSDEPLAFFSINDSTPKVGEDIKLDASGSGDLDGIQSYEWDTDGDGNYEETGETLVLNYSNSSTYNINLKVKDVDGLTDSLSKTVTVESDGWGGGVINSENERFLIGVVAIILLLTSWNFLAKGSR